MSRRRRRAPRAVSVSISVEPALQVVRLEFTVPAGSDRVSVQRVGPSGTPAYVRGFQDAPTFPGPLVVRDFEAPIGVPLVYTVQVWQDATPEIVDSGSASIEIPDGGCDDTWLTDLLRPTNTQRLTLEGLDELSYSIPVGVHEILGRRAPITSSDIANAPTFELGLLTESDDARLRARSTLGNGIPVLLRTPPANGIGSLYFAVTGYREQRIVKPAREDDRVWKVSAVQVTRPDPALYTPEPPATYAAVAATFASYADLAAEHPTYDAVLYDYSLAQPADVIGWPPTDV